MHFLQIWIEPKTRGLTPGYDQLRAPASDNGETLLLASRDNRHNPSLLIHRNADVWRISMPANCTAR